MNIFLNVEKGENFGQILQHMSTMENLENTLDTNMLRQVLSMMDGMTSCDKLGSTSQTSQKH